MSRDLGPAMLDHLESKRDTMTPGEYGAKRAEIEELIRQGRAVELSRLEKLARAFIPLECSRKSGGHDLGREFVDVSIS